MIGAHGRHYMVELQDGGVLHCYPRGKKSSLACGDRVGVRRTAPDQGSIESVAERSSLIYRSDQFREKLIAANVSQVVIVLAARPSFSEELLTCCLAAANQQRIAVLIVLNKIDLQAETHTALERLRLYERLGYPLLRLCAKRDVSPLGPLLAGHLNVLVGQSGMGKSTIIKALVPEAAVKIREISEALDSGAHATTSARVYRLGADSRIIDSPGMQTFGLHHLTQGELAEAFPEFRPLIGRCRFNDCRHTVEPGCAIAAATQRGLIEKRRWETYRALARKIANKRPAWA